MALPQTSWLRACQYAALERSLDPFDKFRLTCKKDEANGAERVGPQGLRTPTPNPPAPIRSPPPGSRGAPPRARCRPAARGKSAEEVDGGEEEDASEEEGDGREAVSVISLVPKYPVSILVGALLGRHHAHARVPVGVQLDGLREPWQGHGGQHQRRVGTVQCRLLAISNVSGIRREVKWKVLGRWPLNEEEKGKNREKQSWFC